MIIDAHLCLGSCNWKDLLEMNRMGSQLVQLASQRDINKLNQLHSCSWAEECSSSSHASALYVSRLSTLSFLAKFFALFKWVIPCDITSSNSSWPCLVLICQPRSSSPLAALTTLLELRLLLHRLAVSTDTAASDSTKVMKISLLCRNN